MPSVRRKALPADTNRRVDFYTSSVRVLAVPPWPLSTLNGTGVDLHDPVAVHYTHDQAISFAVMGVSALSAVFATVTVYLRDKGLEGDSSSSTGSLGGSGGGDAICYEDFTTANVDLVTNPTITMWNSVFLWLVVAGHALLASIICSPSSLERIALFTLLVYSSMSGILQPRIQTDGSANTSSYVSSSYTAWGLMYVAAMAMLSGSIPYDPSSSRVQLLAAVGFVDCFLLFFGHAWDTSPVVQTIMNCRMLYAVAWSVINIASLCLLGSGAAGTQFFDSSPRN